MVKIRIVSDKEGLFSSLEASGHAGKSENGSDLVCAAITVLLKTAVLSLTSAQEKSKSLQITVRAEEKGELFLKVEKFSEADFYRLKYLLEFLTIGLVAIEAEHSDSLDLDIESI